MLNSEVPTHVIGDLRRLVESEEFGEDAFESSCYQPFFDYVVEHELALISFAERTLDSHRAPLDDLHRLLDRPVPVPDATC